MGERRVPIRELISSYIGGGWGQEVGSDIYSEEAYVIRGTDIPDASIGVIKDIPLRYHKESNIKSRALSVGDIIFEVSGGSEGQPVGRSLVFSRQLAEKFAGKVIPASFCKKISPDRLKIDPNFLNFIIRKIYNNGEILQWQVQSTGISNFKFEEFLDECKVYLPSIPEQQRIALILSAYNDLLENNTQRVKILGQLVRTIYAEWFENFHFQGYEKVKMIDSKTEFGFIPSGWNIVSLDNIMDFQGGSQPPREEWIDTFTNGYVRMIQIRDYETTKHISYVRDSHKLKKCKLDDIMIARYGASVARICWGLEGAYNVALVKVIPKEIYYKEFLRQFLLTEKFQNSLIGMSGRTAQAGFNKSVLSGIKIVLPNNISLLNQFEEVASNILNLTLKLKFSNLILRETQDLLIHKLVT